MTDSTQYLIDIAAKMGGVDTAAQQLVDLSEGLSGAGTATQKLEQAVIQAKAALEQTGAASTAAAEALAQGEAKYKQMEVAAERAARALEKAGQQSKGAVPIDLKQKADAAAAALKAEATALDALKAKATEAAGAHQKMAAGLKNLEAAAKAAAKADEAAKGSGKVNEMAEAFGRLGGPVGVLGQKVTATADGVKKLMGAMGAGIGVAVALAAAIALVVVGLAAAAVAAAGWAVAQADAQRSAALNVEALEASSDRLADLGKILPGVSRATGMATDELAGLAKQLDAAKVSAEDMPAALRATAMAEAALGKGAAGKLVEDLKSGKKSAAALAAEMDKKFGGIVAKKLLSLDAQTERLQKNLGKTFGGLVIDPLLEGLSKLVALFDESTASGQTLKAIFEALFQPLIDAATRAIPVIEAFLLGIQIGALKLYIAFKPAIQAVQELFGKPDGSLEATLQSAKQIGELFAIAMVVGGVVIAGAMALVVAAIAAIPIALYNLIDAGVQAWKGVRQGAQDAIAYLRSIDLAEIGANMMAGLARGITDNAGVVLEAMGGVAGSAIGLLRAINQEGSPAKLYKKSGRFVTEGYAEGIEDGTGDVQSALERMADPPAAREPAGGRGGDGARVDLAGATFNFYGVKDAEHGASLFEDALESVFGGQLGLEPAT